MSKIYLIKQHTTGLVYKRYSGITKHYNTSKPLFFYNYEDKYKENFVFYHDDWFLTLHQRYVIMTYMVSKDANIMKGTQ